MTTTLLGTPDFDAVPVEYTGFVPYHPQSDVTTRRDAIEGGLFALELHANGNLVGAPAPMSEAVLRT